MFFKQFVVEGMGCLSYLIGGPGAGVCCVVDPKRDVQDYLDVARKNGMHIRRWIPGEHRRQFSAKWRVPTRS